MKQPSLLFLLLPSLLGILGHSSAQKRDTPAAIVSAYYLPPTAQDPFAFSYSYESEDGTRQSAEGQRRSVGEASVVVMTGSYQYVGDDGKTYTVNWRADENGFQPVGDHILASEVDSQQVLRDQQPGVEAFRRARTQQDTLRALPAAVSQPPFRPGPSPPLSFPPTAPAAPIPRPRRPLFVVKRRRQKRGPQQLSNQFFRTLSYLI